MSPLRLAGHRWRQRWIGPSERWAMPAFWRVLRGWPDWTRGVLSLSLSLVGGGGKGLHSTSKARCFRRSRILGMPQHFASALAFSSLSLSPSLVFFFLATLPSCLIFFLVSNLGFPSASSETPFVSVCSQ